MARKGHASIQARHLVHSGRSILANSFFFHTKASVGHGLRQSPHFVHLSCWTSNLSKGTQTVAVQNPSLICCIRSYVFLDTNHAANVSLAAWAHASCSFYWKRLSQMGTTTVVPTLMHCSSKRNSWLKHHCAPLANLRFCLSKVP